ncbi:MAG: MFS transporter [Dehalococcoidia bacterium]|nr:MFS transporter [Dehalococcoidia bacterium]
MLLRLSPLKLRRPRIFYGWWIVFAGFALITYGWGTFFYGFSSFFNPIRNEFGWSAAATAFAASLRSMEMGIAAPVVGFLVDRVGPKILMVFGVVVVGLGFLAMSQIHSLPMYYASFLIISTGFSFASGPSSVAVVNWFSRKRTMALAVLLSATLPAGFLTPLIPRLIEALDWRTALVVIGVGMWVFCLPLAALVRHRPEPYGIRPDGDPPLGAEESNGAPGSRPSEEVEGMRWRQAIRHPSFWLIAVAGTMGGAAVGAVLVLLVPYLESVGVSSQQAAGGFAILGPVSVVGRIGMGWLGDRMDKRYLLAFAYGLTAVGTLMFAFVTDFKMAVIALLVISPGYGGPVPLRPAQMAEYFGRRDFGAIQGLQGTLGAVGGFLAPLVAARIFDVTGSYRQAWIIFAGVAVLGMVLILFARRPKEAEAWATGGSKKTEAPESPTKNS